MFNSYIWMKHPILDNCKVIYKIYFAFTAILHVAQV